MWSRIEDSTRLPHLPAEITQVDLCGVALEVAAWGTPLAQLSFLDALPEKSLRVATDTLTMLHLLNNEGHITPLGRSVLGLPLHPRLGTMVARNRDLHPHGWIACVVAALLVLCSLALLGMQMRMALRHEQEVVQRLQPLDVGALKTTLRRLISEQHDYNDQ